MKTATKISAILMLFIFSVLVRPTISEAQNANLSFQVFYDNLSPYGDWVYDSGYGYVWIPDVDPGFRPYYSNGHWVFTEYGWTWISDYPWGWAPFHYGRWYYDPMYGDIWIPGNEWGPAWVTWRRANGYYGWAPLGPDVSINIAISNSYNLPHDRWVFVQDRYITRQDLNRYYVDRHENVTIINNSTVINNTYIDNSRNVTYIAGPDRREIQKRTGRDVRQVSVRESTTPGQKVSRDQVQLYRPRVEKRSGDNQRIAPTKVATYKDVKPVAEKRKETRQNVDQRQKRQETGTKLKQVEQNKRDVQQNQVIPADRTKQNGNTRQEQKTKQDNQQNRERPSQERVNDQNKTQSQERLSQPKESQKRVNEQNQQQLERQSQERVKEQNRQNQQGQEQQMNRQQKTPDRQPEVDRQQKTPDRQPEVDRQQQVQPKQSQQPSRREVRQQNKQLKQDATKQQQPTPRKGRNERK